MAVILNGRTVNNIFYHPNDGLVHVIVKAWVDSTYKGKLLSFPGGTYKIGDKPTSGNYNSTRAAIQQEAPSFNLSKPVVLTFQQHSAGYIMDEDEVVFVLPDHLDAGQNPSHLDAETAMGATPCGM